jgi:hypothetical protein
MIYRLMQLLRKITERIKRHYLIPSRLDHIQEALGRIESRLNQEYASSNPRDFEFKVYSQWGEDGIIDYLTTRIDIPKKIFVEFGVETYSEANTLFLLKHRQWRGLIIDGSTENISTVQGGHVFWRYDLMVDCSFITRDNINEILSRNGIQGDIGLLSIDIDGNDYWVWESISGISPRLIIAEYNSLFGATAAISTPYKSDFLRAAEHASKMYYGASIAALTNLARSRGYSLVAGNSAGNNVFFVRNDCLGSMQAQEPSQAYVQSAFREARSPAGAVELLSFAERQRAIAHLPVVDVVSGRHLTVGAAL